MAITRADYVGAAAQAKRLRQIMIAAATYAESANIPEYAREMQEMHEAIGRTIAAMRGDG